MDNPATLENANPNHYSDLTVSPIDAMDAIEISEPFCKGSAIKHLMRKKDGPVDLLKAVWYCVYLYARAMKCSHEEAKDTAIGTTKALEELCEK